VQYNLGFYLQYLATWPEYCTVAADPTGRTMAYSTHHLNYNCSLHSHLSDLSLRVWWTWSADLTDWRHTVLGKAEGRGTDWHGHVTAVTVAPEYRRLGLGERLMSLLEHVSHHVYAAAAAAAALCSRARHRR
jgi:N-terminal acetyltransferase B complex catalytic subunit